MMVVATLRDEGIKVAADVRALDGKPDLGTIRVLAPEARTLWDLPESVRQRAESALRLRALVLFAQWGVRS